MGSWNVNGLTVDKMQTEEFVSILNKHDIVFVYETWASETSVYDLDGYICHSYYRSFQHRNARRASGGVLVMYRSCISEGISVVKNHHNTVIWLKLDKTFFKTEEDIYVGGVYVWPDGSPAYDSVDVDFFEILQNDIIEYSELGSVFLTGDFNARVGLRNDFIICDLTNSCIDDSEYFQICPQLGPHKMSSVTVSVHAYLTCAKLPVYVY